MPAQPLTQVLILLLASVVVVAVARRQGLPPILGYLVVGMLLGPLAFGVLPNGEATHALADIGVVFLLFTLGLDFLWARMLAMRREVFGLGAAQLLAIGAVVIGLLYVLGVKGAPAVVVGGAVAMSSTAIVLQQLTDQSELNRTHGRLSFAVLLFQDLAFVPLLALATALVRGGGAFTGLNLARLVVEGLLALFVVLAIGRWLLRPLFYEIAHSRLRELFTLTVLLVVLSCAWITQLVGLSMALGAFLAGMMLAETEYRHQVESAVRPFRELLLGLFFISVGMLLDVRLLYVQFLLVTGLLVLLLVVKSLLIALVTRLYVDSTFKAVRTSVVLAGGGEFGVALLTLLVQQHQLLPVRISQPLLAALVLSMVLSPLLIRYNRRIARALLGERGPPATAMEREAAATSAAGAARTRDPVRLRPRRPEHRPGARIAGFRVPGRRPGSGPHPPGATGRRRRAVRRQRRRGTAAPGRHRQCQRRDHYLRQPGGIGGHRARRAPPARRCAGAGAHAG